jgi:protein SCO1/2
MRRYIGAGALLAIVLVTVGWWALALWPTSTHVPEWLLRTRLVCFGDRGDGLPNASGWLVLIGQPASMFGFLFIVWSADVVRSLRAVWSTRAGRMLSLATSAALLIAASAAALRVVRPQPLAAAALPSTAVRRMAEVPPLTLVDQNAVRVDVAQFRGRPIVVAFAYAHCETVCPLIVHDVIAAVRQTAVLEPVGLIITVDPWRDTPARLPAIARRWQVPRSVHVLSGTVAEVNGVLEAWEVGSARDPVTGEITHGGNVYVIARDGHSAFVTASQTTGLVSLLRVL